MAALAIGVPAVDAATTTGKKHARHAAKAKAHKSIRQTKKAKRSKQAEKVVHASPAPTGTLEIPVTFTVRNTNTSMVPCAADGKTYTVSGHLVGPAERLAAKTPQAVSLYVHGLGYGEFFWDFKGVPGYDYAAEQAATFAQISVVIDRLGYGASGRPDGNKVCYGSEADYLNQIVTQLRAGTYHSDPGSGGARAFRRIALVGHSAAGFMSEVSAASYRNIDALILAGFSNAPTGVATYQAFTQSIIDCQTAPLPGNYAYFGKTDADFRAGHLYNVDPAVAKAVTAMRAPDPCMDTGSAIPAVAFDALRNGTIKVPVLIVNGANDALFPPPDGNLEKQLFAGNHDLTQTTLPDTGHAVTLGRTAPRFRSVVGGWLRGHGF
jgi:pimeloyl-ACP methyl ester carboxylesterase